MPIIGLLICFTFSCQSKDVKAKKQMIENRISELQSEIGRTDDLENNKSAGDSIIGIWEVDNKYYKAIYEIIKHNNQYYGKIHYFNDGSTEYKGSNSKKDYFLDDLTYQDGKFSFAKMHMPDGSYYQVKILLDRDKITAQMTIQGKPYQEIWKRKKLKDITDENTKENSQINSTKNRNHESK